MSYSAAQTLPLQNKAIPADLLSIPGEDTQACLRVRFNALMLGYLALNNFSDDPRWITVVTSKVIDQQSYKSIFGDKMFGDRIRLRIIKAKAEDLLWITWQCLAQGNSFAVISTVDDLNTEESQQLGNAANMGNCTFHQV